MPSLRPLLLITVLAGCAHQPANAQRIPSISEGKRVRIQNYDSTRIEGFVVSATDTLLQIRGSISDQATRIVEVHATDIERLWVRSHAAGAGAIVGGSLAAAGWAVLVAAACSSLGCEDADATAIVGFGLGVTVGGAAVGAVIGRAIPRWRRLDLERLGSATPTYMSHGVSARSQPAPLTIGWSIRF